MDNEFCDVSWWCRNRCWLGSLFWCGIFYNCVFILISIGDQNTQKNCWHFVTWSFTLWCSVSIVFLRNQHHASLIYVNAFSQQFMNRWRHVCVHSLTMYIREINYRPYLVYCCPNLRNLDGSLVTNQERSVRQTQGSLMQTQTNNQGWPKIVT